MHALCRQSHLFTRLAFWTPRSDQQQQHISIYKCVHIYKRCIYLRSLCDTWRFHCFHRRCFGCCTPIIDDEQIRWLLSVLGLGIPLVDIHVCAGCLVMQFHSGMRDSQSIQFTHTNTLAHTPSRTFISMQEMKAASVSWPRQQTRVISFYHYVG